MIDACLLKLLQILYCCVVVNDQIYINEKKKIGKQNAIYSFIRLRSSSKVKATVVEIKFVSGLGVSIKCVNAHSFTRA